MVRNEKKIDKSPFAGEMLSAETKGLVKRIRCKGCDHSFDATFFRKNIDANSVGYCPVCGRCDFEFVVRPKRR